MKIKSLFTASLLLTSLSSQAGIVYEWHGIKKESPSEFSMTIEFDEATVRIGGFSLHVAPGDMIVRPDSGLIAFDSMYTAYYPRLQPFNSGYDFGYFDMDVNFEGKFLTGSIRMYDFQARLNLATGINDVGNSHLFTIYDTDADYTMGDCAGSTGIPCWGGTGYLSEVPEPASTLLFGIGALTAYGVRRRRIV
jgi:hypothetical protein